MKVLIRNIKKNYSLYIYIIYSIHLEWELISHNKIGIKKTK